MNSPSSGCQTVVWTLWNLNGDLAATLAAIYYPSTLFYSLVANKVAMYSVLFKINF